MSMTPKNRLFNTLTHQPVDRLPTQINYTAAMGAKMAAHFNVAPADLPTFLGNHLLRVDLTSPQQQNAKGYTRYDWWGVGFNTAEEGYLPVDNPLAENKDLHQFAWPDPQAVTLLDDARIALEADAGQHFCVPNFGFALFERAWSLRGMENFLLDMAMDEAYTLDLLDRITEIQTVLIRRFADLGVDGGYFGDDYGTQESLLFSPAMWRELIKPRLARMFAPFRERNLPIIMHSDGCIREIIPDLVEIGLTVLNPVQPEVLDHKWLWETFGGELAFYGGISTQTVLPMGRPDQVREAVMDVMARLAPNKTGLLLAPSHRMMTDIPMANVEVLLGAFKVLGDNNIGK